MKIKNNKKTVPILFIAIGLILSLCGFFFGDFNKKEDREEQNDNGNIVEKKELTKEEILANYNNNGKEYKEVSVDDEVVSKLFKTYHQISVASKEQIALLQLSESDLINVSCDFVGGDTIVNAVKNGGEMCWCGTLTEEIERAWLAGDSDRVIELMKQNTTEGVKTEVLKNKVKELFGTDELNESIFLVYENTKEHWLANIPGSFIEFKKISDKDYYARLSAAGGDPSDVNDYVLKAAYDNAGYLYLVYEVIPNAGESSIHVMMFEKNANGNYMIVKDM